MSEEVKVTFVEAELTKISLQPGDVLGVTVTIDELDDKSIQRLQKQLSDVFPNNKVMVFHLPHGDTIKFEAIEQPKLDCSSEVGYCSDCSCGKKEQAEGAKS